MNNMSSVPASNALPPPRKSFAQVAAAANISKLSKEKPSNKSNNVQNAPNPVQAAPGANNVRSERDMIPSLNGLSISSNIAEEVSTKSDEPQPLPVLLQGMHLQDNVSGLAIPELMARREPDTKSVASRTTITLDEKESLRPDDSASMHAAPEEDLFSPSGSIAAESRESGDADAKAFREQLIAIDRTGAAAAAARQLPVVLPRIPVVPRGVPMASPPAPIVTDVLNPSTITISETPAILLGTFVIPPDEKLLEALASPKDRLFVLKIEQDMIDFVKDPKEEFLQLPQTNSFYRMLSHKLADYYMLGHIVDDSLTSVRIHRTSQTRLPPPLIGPASTTDGSTPPPSAPARKIMRRMLERDAAAAQRRADGFDSQYSSKPPSDTGAGSGGEDLNDDYGKVKDKAALTREERENRYKEARARIFKDWKEESAEATEPIDKEVSRSSSASGVKKSKKTKKPKDDGFEARSAYSQYGTQTFQSNSITTPTSDGAFYNPFAPYALANLNTQQTPLQGSPIHVSHPSFSPYGQQNVSAFSNWPNVMQPANYMMPQTPNGSYYGSPNGYGPSNVYGSPVQQSYSSPDMTSSLTPKPSYSTPAGYPAGYMAPSEQMMWGQGSFNNDYNPNGMMYASGNTGMPSTGFMPAQMMYPPGALYDGSSSPNGQFFPTAQQQAFDRQQSFNPRSQAFVPHHPTNNAPPQRQVSSTSQMQMTQHSPNGTRTNGHGPFTTQTSTTKPLQSTFSSTISKWGDPSTLPPKPPPPAIPSPSLPPNPYSNVARIAGNDTSVQTAH